MKLLLTGKGLTLVVGLVVFAMDGATAGLAAVMFGLLATTIQYVAARRAAAVPRDADFAAFVKGWAWGSGLRLAGVVAFVVVCTIWPERFPAIAVAMGYLGVLIPLLFLETRATR